MNNEIPKGVKVRTWLIDTEGIRKFREYQIITFYKLNGKTHLTDQGKRNLRMLSRTWKKKYCEECKETQGLTAHHIKPLREIKSRKDIEDVLKKENIKTLCKYCHVVEELKSGNKHHKLKLEFKELKEERLKKRLASPTKKGDV